MRRVIAAIVALCAAPGFAQDSPELAYFLGAHGCVINDETRAAAMAQGFDGGAVDALAAHQRGGVLPRALCTIIWPAIDSPLAMDDPVILATLTGPEPAYEGAPKGCFLVGVADALVASKRYDSEQASRIYARFLAAGVLSGRLSFYGEDILVVPPGPQVIADAGPCADLSDRAQMRNARLIMGNMLDEMVRGHAAMTPCADGQSELDQMFFMERLHEFGSPNAWGFFELAMIFHAAGWADIGPGQGGVTPPLCHTEAG
ncbi:MAG: hypothetical protein Q4G36_01995 [Paracoccus sp. (in: a-proteobacteria)]|nr:hypothetical protein [Paracoccus sp. (in: a-proteobacteria)]